MNIDIGKFPKDELMKPSDPEKGLPETLRETFPNDTKMAGTIAIFCIGETIEVKVRGLSFRQIIKIFALILGKCL